MLVILLPLVTVTVLCVYKYCFSCGSNKDDDDTKKPVFDNFENNMAMVPAAVAQS